MIIVSKCPYRISLLGGGSDINCYLKEAEFGLCLGTSINQYSTIVASLKSPESKKGILNYSVREEYAENSLIAHNLIRKTFLKFNISSKVELTSFGSIENGSGLGGSSSFLVALVGAITDLQNKNLNKEQIIKSALEIEVNEVGSPIGGQDHYLSQAAGNNTFSHNNGVLFKKCIATENAEKLISQCYLIFTNINRSASKVLNKMRVQTLIKTLKIFLK